MTQGIGIQAQGEDSIPLRWIDEFKATLGLAIPLVITQVGQIAIQTTDVLMLGRLGETALAASSLDATMGTFLWLFGVGIVTAVAPLPPRPTAHATPGNCAVSCARACGSPSPLEFRSP